MEEKERKEKRATQKRKKENIQKPKSFIVNRKTEIETKICKLNWSDAASDADAAGDADVASDADTPKSGRVLNWVWILKKFWA